MPSPISSSRRRPGSRYLFLIGTALLVAGFLYEAVFNGLPYPDPTPEIIARWEFNETVAGYMYMAGGLFLLAGFVMLIIRMIYRKSS